MARSFSSWAAFTILFFSIPANAQIVFTDSSLTSEIVATGLDTPTTMAFLGPGDILVLQKNNGQVRRVLNGVLQPTPVLDVAVANSSERGLLGIAINTESPPKVFLYYTESTVDGGSPLGNRVYRYTWNPGNPPNPDAGRLQSPVLIRNLPGTPGPNHDGGVLVLGPPEAGLAGDGSPIYAVIGDLNRDGQLENFAAGPAPDDTGVILRFQQDGTAHPGNPFFPYCSVATTTTCTTNSNCPAGQTCVTAVASYYAYGVRNSFGLGMDPVTEDLWDTENGPASYDEVNHVAPGFNSGWERIMGPVSRDAQGTTDLFDMPGPANLYSDPEFSWLDTIAPTAILFPVGSVLGPAYDGVALVGDSNLGNVYRFPLNAGRQGFVLSGGLADLVADTAAERESLRLASGFAGVTDLKIGPDGAVYVVSIGDGRIYRIRAAGTPTATPTSTSTPVPPTPTRTPTRTPTSSATSTGTATPSPNPASVHVGDLDGSSANLGKNWQATVSIAVHDASHAPIAGATASGAWSGGASAAGSCVTAGNGSCNVTSPLIAKKNGTVLWTVNAVSSSGRVYQPAANHDPDGDSNGTAISVRK